MANLVARAIGRLRCGPRSAVIGGTALGLVAMIVVGLAFGPLRSPGGPGVSIGKDSAGAELKPHHSTDEVVTALRASLSADDRVVSISVARLIDFKAIAGDQPSGNGDDLLWYVRFAGPAPAFPPMAWGAGDSGWKDQPGGASEQSNCARLPAIPSPVALSQASLRVQRLKKTSSFFSGGAALIRAFSRAEQKAATMSAISGIGRHCSTSTPSGPNRPTAHKARLRECEQLK